MVHRESLGSALNYAPRIDLKFAAWHKKQSLSSLGFWNAKYISAKQSFIIIFKCGNTGNGIRKAEVTYHVFLIYFSHASVSFTVDQNSFPFSRIISLELGSSVSFPLC